MNESFVIGGWRGRRVSGKELRARRQDEHQIDGKEGREQELDETGVLRGNPATIPRHHEREQAAKANVGTSQNGLEENVVLGQQCIRLSLFGKGKVGIFRRLG